MTIREIDDYLEKQYFPTHKKIGRKEYSPSILTSQLGTIEKYIPDNPYKRETFYALCAERKEMIPKMLESGYITIEDILEFIEESQSCEFLCSLPDDYCEDNQRLIDGIISNKEKIMYDLLPKSLRNNPQIQESFHRPKSIDNSDLLDKNGRDTNWCDQDGNLVEYFTLQGDVKITSKEDYLFIVDKYTKSDMSVPFFCNTFGISSIDGFNKLLNRVIKEETSMRDAIEEAGLKTQNEYIRKIIRIAEEIDSGKLDFDTYMREKCNYYQRFSLLFQNTKNKENLMNQVLEYIQANQEELPNMLFSLMETTPTELYRTIVLYSSCAGVDIDEIRATIRKITTNYRKGYSRKDINGISGSIQGREYKIDDEVIDQALEYVRCKDIYLCNYTMQIAAKKMALGEIDYSQEVEARKQEIIENIKELSEKLIKVSTISEYIEIMEEESHKKKGGSI